MIGLDSYSRQAFYLFGPHFDLNESLNRLPIWNSQNCSMFPLAFVAGWLQDDWWGFISRNYVVWPTFLLMNVFIALKLSHFWILFVAEQACLSLTWSKTPKTSFPVTRLIWSWHQTGKEYTHFRLHKVKWHKRKQRQKDSSFPAEPPGYPKTSKTNIDDSNKQQ